MTREQWEHLQPEVDRGPDSWRVRAARRNSGQTLVTQACCLIGAFVTDLGGFVMRADWLVAIAGCLIATAAFRGSEVGLIHPATTNPHVFRGLLMH